MSYDDDEVFGGGLAEDELDDLLDAPEGIEDFGKIEEDDSDDKFDKDH